jgi:N-formylglutamate amidohydrolase
MLGIRCKPAIKLEQLALTPEPGAARLIRMDVQSVMPAEAPPLADPPFVILRPEDAAPAPLVFASPHSGRFYPTEMMAASVLDAAAIRRSEDAFVDDLTAGATGHGAVVIQAAYARAYVDVNREPYELDASMFEDELPAFAATQTIRAAAGLGSIARVVGEGQEIYGRKLTFAEARRRIETVHEPYHAALRGLIDEAVERFGRAVLIDWHSMPSAATRGLWRGGELGGACDLVLGDRFGAACSSRFVATVQGAFEAMGYRVARNAPYAGGYTTQHYGAPERGVEALQIEINRAIYLDETTLALKPGFIPLKRDLERVFAAVAAWATAS